MKKSSFCLSNYISIMKSIQHSFYLMSDMKECREFFNWNLEDRNSGLENATNESQDILERNNTNEKTNKNGNLMRNRKW